MKLREFLKEVKANRYLLGNTWYHLYPLMKLKNTRQEISDELRLNGTIEDLKAIRWYDRIIEL